MSMRYKIDIISALKTNGYSTYKIRIEKIFGEATLQKFRTGSPVDWDTLEKLCKLLQCQPGDILEFVDDE